MREQFWMDHYRGLGKLINTYSAVAPVVVKEVIVPREKVVKTRVKKERAVSSKVGSHNWIIFKLTSPKTTETHVGC